MPCSSSSIRTRLVNQRGSALVIALCLVLVLAVAGVAIVVVAGKDRISASKLGIEDRGLACAEAGLQYARRYFGTRYETSHGWNDYLSNATGFAGYRYDTSLGDDGSGVPTDAKGDFDGDGVPDFWVSIRDDDDERPLGAADDRTRDNNEMVVIRSECINDAYAIIRSGQRTHVILESTLAHIQGGSGYATSGPTNSADIVGQGR